MSLMIISEQTTLHINFYVTFEFMRQEETSDYVWIMQQLRAVYVELKLSNFIVIIIDMKRELMNDCEFIFEIINHFFCLWHININVLTKCKSAFFDKKTWNVFYLKWKLIMYSSSEEEFWTSWIVFIEKHRVINSHEMKYLINIYIIDFRDRFIKIFINQMLHFDIIITSREKDAHAILKRQLNVSIEDLKTIINEIDLLLMNKYSNHTLVIENAKIRFSFELRLSIYQLIASYVIYVVIRKIHS
jgi:hypothetical protein